ncbi:MAG: spermine synthase [Anaerolineae bacterium]
MIVLSRYQIKPLLRLRGAQSTASVSPDLGLTTVEVALDDAGVIFPGGERLTWDDAARIFDAETSCFALEAGEIRKIQVFSQTTNRHCSLMPTSGAPTLLIAGFPMHRIKNTDPHRDTLSKIKAARPAGRGARYVDGLGPAVRRARTSNHVVTIERQTQRWSKSPARTPGRAGVRQPAHRAALPGRQRRIDRDLRRQIVLLHHPRPADHPACRGFVLRRVLPRVVPHPQARGRLFHYIGDLDSPSVSRIVRSGVVERLGAAGFRDVKRRPEAFGVVAQK